MGQGLADRITQGNAMGLSSARLHCGNLGQRRSLARRRTTIAAGDRGTLSRGSEANRVIANFNAQPNNAKQALLDFLRSL